MDNCFAIVTGTSSGLGACVVRDLAARGWRVAGISRRAPDVTFASYHHLSLDLSDPREDAAALPSFLDGLGLAACDRVGLVNNAGRIAPVGPLAALSLPDLAASLALNAAVPAWLMGAVAARSGAARLRVVNVSSGAATAAYPGWAAYCMGKAALRMAGQVMSVEADEVPALRGRDVAVVSYAPGVIDTPMQSEVRASPRDQFPRLQKFLDLQASGALVDPGLPAAEICRLLERDDLPRFSETRYGA
jgi:NAD(P)-dependent dehydrogenase (short-subunit alcohol dehydrogenase family)